MRAHVDRQRRDRGGWPPSSQPPEHAATISAADTSNTAGPAARRTAAHAGADLRDRVGDRVARPGPADPVPAGRVACVQPHEPDPDRLGVRGEPRQPARAPSRPGGPPPPRSAANPNPPPEPPTPPRSPPPHRPAGPGRTAATARASGRTHPPPSRSPAAAGSAAPTRRSPARTAARHAPTAPTDRRNPGTPAHQRPAAFDWTGSGPTLSNGPPPGAFERPFPAACQRMREGPLTIKITPSLSSRPHHDAAMPANPLPTHILTDSDPKPLRPRHLKRRSTPWLEPLLSVLGWRSGPRCWPPARISLTKSTTGATTK